MTLYTSQCTPSSTSTEPSGGTKGLVITNSASVFFGNSISDVQFYLQKKGSPTVGIVSCELRRCSTGALVHTFWSMNLSDLDPSGAWTSNTTTPYTGAIAVGDIICVTWGSDHLYFYYRQAECQDIGYSGFANSSTACTPPAAWDPWYKITTGSGPSPPPSSGSTVMPPPYANIGLIGL